MTISILRGGETAREWSGKGWGAKVSKSTLKKTVNIRFKIDSGGRGGGVTDVSVQIQKDSFEDIAKAMIEVNSEAAIRAFGVAMQDFVDI